MQKEVVLIMDYRFDEGVRPRKDMISPAICLTNGRGGGDSIPSNAPLILEKWTQSELNKQQNKDI